MVWDKGFNFAQGDTGDNVAPDTYVLGESYPTTRNGVTFGWEDGIDTRGRVLGTNVRLDGINFPTGNQARFRVDLTAAGTYDIRIANGDQGSSQGAQHVEFRDTTTTLVTLDDAGGTATSHFNDATGVDYSEAAWGGSNTASRQTFGTTLFRLVMGNAGGGGGAHVIAHLFLSQVAVTATLPRPKIVTQAVKRAAYW